jgi:hypothetical protein
MKLLRRLYLCFLLSTLMDMRLLELSLEDWRGFNIKTQTNQMKKPIKQIKKELGIKNADIAKAFGYVNANSYATSTAKPRLQKGIEWLYETIKTNEK